MLINGGRWELTGYSMFNTLNHFLLRALVVALLAVCCFLPGLGGGFIFDDKPNIVTNTSLHVTQLDSEDLLYAAYSFEPGRGSRALPMLTFALDHLRGGLDARNFKITNLLIHALTTVALAFLFRQLLLLVQCRPSRAETAALVLALLWAIHPLQVSSVLYVVQRMQTLCTLFIVLALWAYLMMRQAQCEGLRSRLYVVLVGLFWALAMASKEDAALLPAYMLAVELTVFRFAARRLDVAAAWRWGYIAVTILAVLAYVFVVIPRYWHWDAYPGRDFSSYERILTQGRVLLMYLQQMLMPLPSSMPFYYDDLIVSRGLLSPPSTMFAWSVMLGLMAWAIMWLRMRPLFSLGVFIFFAGHAVASNIVNLELAFEHRNQIPLLGVVIFMFDLTMLISMRFEVLHRWFKAIVLLLICAVGGVTLYRAYTWGDPLRFAENSVALAPNSGRSWLMLSSVYADRSGMDPSSPLLRQAIVINEMGAARTGSVPLMANVVTFKEIVGQEAEDDWGKLLARLKVAPMNVENVNVLWVFLGNAEKGFPVDERHLFEVIDVVSSRASLNSGEYLRIGAYIHNESMRPRDALKYLKEAVRVSRPGDPAISNMQSQLEAAGRGDWVKELRLIEPGAQLH